MPFYILEFCTTYDLKHWIQHPDSLSLLQVHILHRDQTKEMTLLLWM